VAVADYLSRPTSKGSPKSRLTSFAVIPLRPLCRRLLSCVALLRLLCLLLFATTRAEASLCCRCCLAFQCYHDCRADGVPSQEFLKRLDDDMSGVADTNIAVLGKPSTRLRARESSSQINYDVPLIAVVLEMLFAELTRALAQGRHLQGRNTPGADAVVAVAVVSRVLEYAATGIPRNRQQTAKLTRERGSIKVNIMSGAFWLM
jgi:hypothetical protein